MDLDFDTEQRLIGLELLSASKQYSHPISSTCPPKPDPGWWLGAVNRSTRCASRVPRTESLILEILKPSYFACSYEIPV